MNFEFKSFLRLAIIDNLYAGVKDSKIAVSSSNLLSTLPKYHNMEDQRARNKPR